MAAETNRVLEAITPRYRRSTLLRYERVIVAELCRFWLAHKHEMGGWPSRNAFEQAIVHMIGEI